MISSILRNWQFVTNSSRNFRNWSDWFICVFLNIFFTGKKLANRFHSIIPCFFDNRNRKIMYSYRRQNPYQTNLKPPYSQTDQRPPESKKDWLYLSLITHCKDAFVWGGSQYMPVDRDAWTLVTYCPRQPHPAQICPCVCCLSLAGDLISSYSVPW